MNEGLGPESFGAALRARRAESQGSIGRRFECHERIDSTSDRARDLAASGEPEGTVVLAGEQTRGRGRAGRSWHSAPELGLYLSVILRPQAAPTDAPLFGLLAAVAAASALGRFAPSPIGIKWPNDLVVEAGDGGSRRKLGGILAEARASSHIIRDLVVGVGVNVNHVEADFPSEIVLRATSMRLLCGRGLDRVAVAVEILTALDEWYTLWSREGETPILTRYRTMALDLEGRCVRVIDGPRVWSGTTAGLTREGALMVVPDGGSNPVAIRYGEVRRVEEV